MTCGGAPCWLLCSYEEDSGVFEKGYGARVTKDMLSMVFP